ncbi:unnamed protein product, partial [Anisakis simplex]|uniref:Uncharacterized protein n=1 Tax=Anisakis simplex TaxID=6269 RepID=A0A0M3JF58_ANISI
MPEKHISSDFIKTTMNMLTFIMDRYVTNDQNPKRSSLAKKNVLKAMSSYQQLLSERKKALDDGGVKVLEDGDVK